MKLFRTQPRRYLTPGERRPDRSAGIRPQNVRRGNRLALGNLGPVEINLALFAARYRARRGEQIGPLPGRERGQQFGERSHLFVGVVRLERDENVHSIAARRFWITFELREIELAAHQQRSLHDLLEPALLRIEIDQQVVRIFVGAHAAHPRIVIDATEIHQK